MKCLPPHCDQLAAHLSAERNKAGHAATQCQVGYWESKKLQTRAPTAPPNGKVHTYFCSEQDGRLPGFPCSAALLSVRATRNLRSRDHRRKKMRVCLHKVNQRDLSIVASFFFLTHRRAIRRRR
jgi:hypothetical protein